MLNLEQIESAILQLPLDEYKELSKWFTDRDYQLWDEQLEQDINDGKLEALAQEAIALESQPDPVAPSSIPFWQRATPAERAREFRNWTNQFSRTGVSLPNEALSRDRI
jgi:hypothetical protein